jgi:hypothetical protein
MTSRVITLVLICGLWTGAASNAEDKVPTAQQLLDSAHLRAELTSLAPYTLRATVVFNPGAKNEQTGHLTIYRDRDRSRVDLETGDYNETRVTIGERSYIPKGKHLLMSMGLTNLDQSWDPGRPPRFSMETAYKLGKLKKTTIEGRTAWCIDKSWPHRTERLCFDPASSLLMSEKSRFGDYGDDQEYLDYTSTAQHSFPRVVKIRRHSMVPLEITDVSLSQGSMDDHLFTIPHDTIEVGFCRDAIPPQPVSTPEPDFPASALRETKHALVMLFAIVNTEGRVEEVDALNPDNQGFDAKAKEAARALEVQTGNMRWPASEYRDGLGSGFPALSSSC